LGRPPDSDIVAWVMRLEGDRETGSEKRREWAPP
jgi:hypothetical protein